MNDFQKLAMQYGRILFDLIVPRFMQIFYNSVQFGLVSCFREMILSIQATEEIFAFKSLNE